jgi:hypothetical protein
MALPATLPVLPGSDPLWSANIVHAAQITSDLYQSAYDVLASGNFDLHRIRYHYNAITDEALPLLFEMEGCVAEEGSNGSQLDSWLQTCALVFGQLLVKLMEAEGVIQNACVICL